ncbi:MAG: ribonuclease H-like domain-containing protein [Thermaerobacterales bacterium]
MTGSPLAVDIETIGLDWDGLGSDVQDYLLQRARTPEEREAVPDRLALHPGTGRVVAIGMWRPGDDRGGVLAADEQGSGVWEPFEDDGSGQTLIFRASEADILREFWRYVQDGAGTIITFNGRSFDAPFLMLRSAILDVAPSRNLVPYRYSFREHCDLAEVLTFFRARPLDAFHFWCRQFGIESPKSEMDGAGVGDAFRAGKLSAIARYCLQDARATALLYDRLLPIIRLMDKK